MSPTHAVTLAVTMAASAVVLAAQGTLASGSPAYPTRALRIVVSEAAGSPADAVARIVAPRLAAALGQAVSVDNRPADGAAVVARATPDGHTLLLAGPTLAIDVALRAQSAVDPLKELAPVALLARFPYLLVATTTMGLDSVQDIVAIAKASPGRLAYTSPGTGSAAHLAGERFKSATSVHLRHMPAKSQAAGLAELAAGRVQLAFVPLAAATPLLQAGTARAVAVTGDARIPGLPGVPTMREAGVPGFDLTGWVGMLVPASTPRSIVERLDVEVRKVVQASEAGKRIAAAVSGEATTTSPDDFHGLLEREVAGWSRLAREMSIRVE